MHWYGGFIDLTDNSHGNNDCIGWNAMLSENWYKMNIDPNEHIPIYTWSFTLICTGDLSCDSICCIWYAWKPNCSACSSHFTFHFFTSKSQSHGNLGLSCDQGFSEKKEKFEFRSKPGCTKIWICHEVKREMWNGSNMH